MTCDAFSMFCYGYFVDIYCCCVCLCKQLSFMSVCRCLCRGVPALRSCTWMGLAMFPKLNQRNGTRTRGSQTKTHFEVGSQVIIPWTLLHRLHPLKGPTGSVPFSPRLMKNSWQGMGEMDVSLLFFFFGGGLPGCLLVRNRIMTFIIPATSYENKFIAFRQTNKNSAVSVKTNVLIKNSRFRFKAGWHG